MRLLTDEIKARLIRNNVEARGADNIPVVKLFTPWANCTWIITDMEPDGRMFGLCDLGLGEPELGYVELHELQALRGPAGLRVERDLHWTPTKPLSRYLLAAQANRRYIEP